MYKHLSEANINIGELKGIFDLVPNLKIIIKLISISEAKSSLEIDNSYTSYDKIFLKEISNVKVDQDTSSVINYLRASEAGCDYLKKTQKVSPDLLLKVQNILRPENKGICELPKLKIYSKTSSKVTVIPPQKKNVIYEFLENLINYCNNDLDDYDPLIKTALIHYQFECIQPYKEGNDSVGRILNVIYLMHSKKITYPIINLSKYLNETRNQYYSLLEKCHNDISYIEKFVIYLLKGIIETARYTINLTHQINRLIQNTKNDFKKRLPSIYSEEIVLHLFENMYTKNEVFRDCLNISRTTATKYLKELEVNGFLTSKKIGKEMIYINVHLYDIFV